MELVCIDTNMLIWGIQENSHQSQVNMIERTKRFLASIDNKKTRLLLPVFCMTEFLIPIPETEQYNFISVLQQNFIIIPYDARCSIIHTRLWKDYRERRELLKQEISACELKTDYMIVCCAIANHASCIYSHDKGIKSFAENHIEVRDIPDIPYQTTYIKNGE